MINQALARLIALLFIAVVTAGIWFVPMDREVESCDCLKVSFLDVGQGDATLIQTPDGFEMLVDGGKDNQVIRQLASDRSFFDRDIDVVVATHPDSDHIGGLIDVLARYDVDTVVMTTNESDSPWAAAFSEAVASENAAIIYPEPGQQFMLGASTSISIFAPYGDETTWESNNASIVLKVSYGETDFLLPGDITAGTEDFLVEKFGNELQSEVLKLSHHGSRTSTSELFLDTVAPDYAIVSAAIDSPYGHPHQEVMQRVFNRNIRTLHTGTDGSVTFISDGISISLQE